MKFFLATALIVFSFTSHSQIVPKSRFLGGSISASLSKTSNQTIEQFNGSFRPQYGKFISEKWSLQGGFKYQYKSYLVRNPYVDYISQHSRTNRLGITFGATRYFSIADKLYFSLSASISGDISQVKDVKYNTMENPSFSIGTSISPGLNYFINERWMLLGNFGAFQFSSMIDQYSAPDVYFGFNFTTSTTGIGIRYIIKPRS